MIRQNVLICLCWKSIVVRLVAKISGRTTRKQPASSSVCVWRCRRPWRRKSSVTSHQLFGIADDVVIKALLPDRPNIYMDVRRRRSYDIPTEFEWLAASIELQKERCSKTLIFSHSINSVSAIYRWLMSRLHHNAFRDGRTDDPNSCSVSMFHAHIAEPLQQYTLSEFSKPDSTIRVLVCTVAFSMGVTIGDVRQVIHWEKVPSLMTFWQELRRCGSDDESSHAIWYPESVSGEDMALLARITAEDCIRLLVL